MADLTSGDRPVVCTGAALEGQQDNTAPPSAALGGQPALADADQTQSDIEQTLSDSDHTRSDRDQTGADSDQTGSDRDQTSADRDQVAAERDQVAAERDQAASDRDLASGVSADAYEFSRDIRERTSLQREQTARLRNQSAAARLDAARKRDANARARDLAALARDQAAAARDLAMTQRDVAYEQDADAHAVSGADVVIRAAERRRRASQQRAQAAEHRALAAEDRDAAAQDRLRSGRERRRALEDREALACELALAAIDALTGARTRSAGLIELDHELDRCRRANGLLVVAYVDVVGLKTLNDNEGHSVGDELLKRVVGLIKEHLRSYDLIIRLGGDEFLCAMSNMTLADARQRFSRIATRLASATRPGAIRTGFAQLASDQTATELIELADRKMIDGRRADQAVDRSPPTAQAPNRLG